MKLFNSRLAVVAAAVAIMIMAGGTGAVAGGAMSGDRIRNNTVDSSEIQRNTVKARDIGANSVNSSELSDGSVRNRHLDVSVKDSLLAEMKSDEQLDSNGSLVRFINDAPPGYILGIVGHGQVIVTLHVQTTGDKPVQINLSNDQQNDPFLCVAVPAAGLGGSCQATKVFGFGQLPDVPSFDPTSTTVNVTITRVGP